MVIPPVDPSFISPSLELSAGVRLCLLENSSASFEFKVFNL